MKNKYITLFNAKSTNKRRLKKALLICKAASQTRIQCPNTSMQMKFCRILFRILNNSLQILLLFFLLPFFRPLRPLFFALHLDIAAHRQPSAQLRPRRLIFFRYTTGTRRPFSSGGGLGGRRRKKLGAAVFRAPPPSPILSNILENDGSVFNVTLEIRTSRLSLFKRELLNHRRICHFQRELRIYE